MKLALTLPKSRYAVGEDVTAVLVVENDSGAPLEVPDPFHAYNWEPKYTVIGPAHPGGFTFSFRSAARHDPRPHPTDVTPVLTTLAPGARLEGEIPLQQWAPLAEPGPYRVAAQMEWNGVTTASAPVPFVIDALAIVSASLGVDVGVPETRDIWVTWIRRGAGGCEMGDAVFLEVRPDLGEVKRHMMTPVLAVGPQARDALAPWTNYDRKDSLAFWRVWREGTDLLALLAGETQPRAARVDALFATVRPSLMTRDGTLHVFAFETTRRALMHVRFTPGAAPAIARSEAVPGRIVAGGCALPGGEAAESAPHVVAVSSEEGVVAVHCGSLDAGGTLGPLRSAPLPGVRVIPASTPAVRIDARGAVHAVLLLRDAEEPERIVRADVHALPGDDVKVELTRVGRLPREPRSARAVYSASGRRDPRATWAVLLEDDSVVTSLTAEARQVGATPVAPVEIVALTDTTYLLVTSNAFGPLLVALR